MLTAVATFFRAGQSGVVHAEGAARPALSGRAAAGQAGAGDLRHHLRCGG